MAPGTIERLGLGYDVVKEINPGIIYCQVKGFGNGSPYEKSLAFDMIAQAAGGTMSVTGEADRPPVKPGPTFGDTGTGMLMAISILGALYEQTADRQGPAPAGRDAGRDDPLHAHPVRAHPESGTGAAAHGRAVAPGAPRPRRPLPVQAGRLQRLRLHLLQPRQSRALGPPARR